MKKITQTLTVPDNWKQKPMYYPVEVDGKWQRQKVQVEEIDLPALLERQRRLCQESYQRLMAGDCAAYNDKIGKSIADAPSPLDIDYKARSVDYNTETEEK